jgi:uncharacterized damage-inducible protein DinB
LTDRAIAQLPDDKLHLTLDANTNCIAVIIKHMAGNMLSRWTDMLTTDGEKPWRDRDDEFHDTFQSREELLTYWEKGWQCVFGTLEQMSDSDLEKTITIRTQPMTVMRAVCRQLDHYGYHTGQIVQIARIHAGDNWQTLTIARGQSQQYNEKLKNQS